MPREKLPERRSRRSQVPAYEDVELELTQMTFHRYVITVLLGSIATCAATIMVGVREHDPWFKGLAACMLMICTIRTGVAIGFDDRRAPCLSLSMARRRQKIWAIITVSFSLCMAVTTIRAFAWPGLTGPLISTMGTFALASGMASRTSVQPRMLQSCGLIMMGSLSWAMIANCEPALAITGTMLSLFYVAIQSSAIRTKFEIAVEHLRIQHQLRHQAECDTLTGLANRRQFHARLTTLCADLTPFAVLYIDLDRFKQVNDTFGHAMGDALLVRVAERLTSLLRGSDLLARLGGDEFAVLQYPADTEYAAQALAGRINRTIEAPFEIDGQQIEVGTSIGICLAREGVRDPTRLLSLADKALYSVKQAGRGSFQFCEMQG